MKYWNIRMIFLDVIAQVSKGHIGLYKLCSIFLNKIQY